MGEGKARKRVLKQSRKISDEAILEYLTADGQLLTNYYLQEEMLCFWHPSNGSMVMMIDDDVMATAITDYLERTGAPRISSKDELDILAHQRKWTNFTFQRSLD